MVDSLTTASVWKNSEVEIHPIPNSKLVFGANHLRLLRSELANRLDHYAADYPLVLIVLDGALVFGADLIRDLPFPVEVATIKVKSYTGKGKQAPLTSVLASELPAEEKLRGRTIFVVDDILDTGKTFERIRASLLPFAPKQIVFVALFRRDSAPDFEEPCYVGCTVKDGRWLYGYGMDYDNGELRDLPVVNMIELPTP